MPRQSFAARMADARRAQLLDRLTRDGRAQSETARALVTAVADLLDAADAGDTGVALYAEVGTKGKIHVKPLGPRR